MKRNLNLLLGMLVATILLVSCNNSTTEKASEAVDSTKTMADEMMTEGTLPGEIDCTVAENRLSAFDTVSGSVEYVYGFDLNKDDILAVLNDKDIRNQDTIYTMVGFQPADENGPAEFDLIFCIETPINSDSYRYFDFTRPCPTYCPNDTTRAYDRPTVGDLSGIKGYWFGRADMTEVLEDASQSSAQALLMMKEDEADGDIYMVVCELPEEICGIDTNNAAGMTRFQPCNAPGYGTIEGAPECHSPDCENRKEK